jgi:hypothetical protein
MGSGGDADRAPGAAKGPWRSVVRIAAIIAIATGAGVAVYWQRSVTAKGLRNVGGLNWAWFLAASLAEVLSMLALTLL